MHVIRDVGPSVYHFADGGFALIDDQDCYDLVEKASGYFLVSADIAGAPVDDYLDHGYETRADFCDALRRLVGWWGGRTGRNVGHRHGHLLLEFHDTPGGRPDRAWLPLYLLEPVPVPDYMVQDGRSETEKELDRAFGFD